MLTNQRLGAVVVMFLCVHAVRAEAPGVDDLRARISAAGDAARHNADAVVVLLETDVTVHPDGIGEASTCRVVKVLREGGIRGQSVQRFGYDPTTNAMEIKAVRVYRADGRVEEVATTTAADQPEPQWGIYWGSRQMMIEVPRLNVGDAVETRTVKTGFNVAYLADANGGDAPKGGGPSADRSLQPPMPGHWYDEVSFSSGLPVIEQRYIVRVPKDKPLQYEVYHGEVRSSVTLDSVHVVYTFEKKDIVPFQGEPNMVSQTDVACKVVLATLPDWESKSRWFHEKNEPSFEITDEIRAKAAEVVAGLKSDEEKITALNHWVAENIRYIGTSRGACEGYTTHPAQETLRDRGGVCKDKAGLLVAMLRATGFESYIVMTEAGAEVMPVPADQFNHAVTSIRQPDGSFRLLDPTWMPKSRENWSSAEQLQHVVYGTPEGQPLSRSPYSGPENNTITWQGKTVLAYDGTLSGDMTLTTTGVPETNLRRSAARYNDADRRTVVEEGAARLGAATDVKDWKITGPVDFSGPMTVQCKMESPAYAPGDESQRYVALPMMRAAWGDIVAGDVWGTDGPETRKHPLRLRSTRRLSFSESLTLPKGWKAASLPQPKSLDGPAAGLIFKIEQVGDELRYECQVDLKKHRVPPEDYSQYRSVIQALEELRKSCVRIVHDGGVALK